MENWDAMFDNIRDEVGVGYLDKMRVVDYDESYQTGIRAFDIPPGRAWTNSDIPSYWVHVGNDRFIYRIKKRQNADIFEGDNIRLEFIAGKKLVVAYCTIVEMNPSINMDTGRQYQDTPCGIATLHLYEFDVKPSPYRKRSTGMFYTRRGVHIHTDDGSDT